MIKCLITAEKVTDFLPLFSDFDPQLPPNGGREGGNDMTKYFGYKYLVNWPMIIEIYENPLGYFYCLLHTVRVKWYGPKSNNGSILLGYYLISITPKNTE